MSARDAVADGDADADGNSEWILTKWRLSMRETPIFRHLPTKKLSLSADNLVIVDTPDALLVAGRGKSQDVKLVVRR